MPIYDHQYIFKTTSYLFLIPIATLCTLILIIHIECMNLHIFA
jgi:hypothetical protein